MYVKTEKPNLQRLTIPEMNSTAEFSSNNIAQVPEEDGQVLIQMRGFSEHDNNDK